MVDFGTNHARASSGKRVEATRDDSNMSLHAEKKSKAEVDLVVMGSLGDLSRRKLFPALYQLRLSKLIPDSFRIIAVTRSKVSKQEFEQGLLPFVVEMAEEAALDSDVEKPPQWESFISLVELVKMDLTEAEDFAKLHRFLDQRSQAERIFYLAIPPNLYGVVANHLKQKQCVHQASRVVLEKPIGHDLKSATSIHESIIDTFTEDQIFRIDHYLGKETVQNIMALRFANTVLEPLWCAQHIEYMQITVAETVSVGSRAGYYDSAGALRDMVQNHLLQLLCIVAMEPPAQMSAYAVRDEKLKVLHSLRPIQANDVVQKTVRGQYFDLHGLGEPSYRNEPGVDPESDTETFVALKTEVDNWRWAGMPIYLRTGKCMKQQHSEVVIQFKEVPHKLFHNSGSIMSANRLMITLQPEERIRLTLNGKSPGKGMHLAPLVLNLDGASRQRKRHWDAYERLLMDVIHADLTLFMREKDIETAWSWVDPILEGWQRLGHPTVVYAPGTWGPLESDHLLAKDGYIWHNPDAY